MDSARNSTDEKFRFDFLPRHPPPPLSPGMWKVEWDGIDEFTVVDKNGDEVAVLDGLYLSEETFNTNLQCIKLVPELVRAVYVAMHALRGDIPDTETEKTIAEGLRELLARCYASPTVGDTIG